LSNILAISGKKQSGKTTCGNFLLGCAMLSNDVVEYANLDEKGQLIVPYVDDSGNLKPCVFPSSSLHPGMVKYMEENVWSEIKIYNFADPLKALCMDILGMSYEQCYGTDSDKNTKTNFDWADVTSYATRYPSAKMTAREVMQYVGTDFFRKIYPQVWVDSTLRRIKKDNPRLAVVVDCRFENEVRGIQEAGGKVIRLSRNIYGDSDQHPSETALDNYSGFDYVLENQDMDISSQNQELYNKLAEWSFIDYDAAIVVSN